MRIIEKINSAIRKVVVRRVIRTYDKKVDFVFKNRPDLKTQVPEDIKKKHIELYKKLGLPCNDKWLRMYSNLSGIVDYRYVPESLFASVIERVLNDCETSNHEYEDKNLFYKLIDKQYLPVTYIRFVRGCFFDEDFNFMTPTEVDKFLQSDHGNLVGKIASDSCGGKGVIEFVYKDGAYWGNGNIRLSADWIINSNVYYCIQKKIVQCEFTAQFNPYSINTCRMVTLRCPWDGKIVLLKSFLRLGATESIVDNLSSGGVSVSLDSDGNFDSCAYTYRDRKRVAEHPTSKIKFQGLRHPYFKEMSKTITTLASNIPNHNFISWDVIVDNQGQVKIIEANLSSQNPDICQLAFGPLFGDYTEKIIDWVVNHERYSTFKHFRTFY